MAFSSRFAKAKPQAGPPAARTSGEESDEVESVDGDDAAERQRQAEQAAREEERLRKAREDQLRAQEAAARRRQAMEEEAARRREAAEEARRKAEADAARKQAYEEEKARQATIERSKREAARRAMGGSGAGFGGGVSGFGPGGGGSQSFSWKKGSAEDQGGLSFGQGYGGGAAPERPGARKVHRSDMPSHDDCELGISAMISRTTNGMKEGLSFLGLPQYPLVFIPGQELKLCGHNVREEINEMIHCWMTDEKEEFFECLAKVKAIVSKPILTEEEMEMMEKQDDWEKVVGPDGKTIFRQRENVKRDDDDDDDEVIDVPSSGSAARPGNAAAARTTAPAAAAVPPGEEDFYTLLGVDPAASLHEIRTKFRSLVITEHPEKGGDPKKFQKLNKAYGVLSDQKKRQEYDESIGVGTGARGKRFVD